MLGVLAALQGEARWLHILTRRDDDTAFTIVDDDVGAIGLGEAWCALEEFFGVHISEDGMV